MATYNNRNSDDTQERSTHRASNLIVDALSKNIRVHYYKTGILDSITAVTIKKISRHTFQYIVEINDLAEVWEWKPREDEPDKKCWTITDKYEVEDEDEVTTQN